MMFRNIVEWAVAGIIVVGTIASLLWVGYRVVIGTHQGAKPPIVADLWTCDGSDVPPHCTRMPIHANALSEVQDFLADKPGIPTGLTYRMIYRAKK